MSDLPNCETQTPSEHFTPQSHSFQTAEANVMKPTVPVLVRATMLYCTKCGVSYLFDADDGRWHPVALGNAWHERLPAREAGPA